MMLKNRVTAILFLFLLIHNNLSAQDTFISGKVFDAETQQPIPFVSICQQGISSGTMTNNSGEFELEVNSPKESEIVFSHLNYSKKEIRIAKLNNEEEGIVVLLEPKQELLDNVIVSASLYKQSQSTLAKATAIVHQKEIKDNFNSNIIDVLSTTPGFSQVWEYHSPIILRGLNSKRLVIMKNGNRRIGTFPGGYFGQDMNVYDVKKIEIIKGPGSVVYGSGAISGIVNVIGYEPLGPEETKANILSGYGSNNNEFLETANFCYKRENFGIRINGKFRKTGNYDYGNGETAENSDVEDRDFSLTTGLKIASKQMLTLNADYHYGDWGKPRGFNGSSKRFTKIRNEEENLHADISYTYNPGTFFEELKAAFYVDDGYRDYYKYKYSEVSARLSSLDLVHYKDFYGGGNIYAILNLSENSKLTVGGDGYAFRLDNPSDVVDYYNETEGTLDGYIDAGQQNIGAFVRNEVQLSEKIKVVSGVRYDYAEVLEGKNATTNGRSEKRTAFSGNLGTVFSFNENIHLSANIGRAFRMPTAEELFTETISCKGTKKGNPELTPEYSWNFDLGLRGNSSNKNMEYDIALFYNVLDDFICETQALDDDDIDFTFENTDAVIFGGELSASYQFQHVLKYGNSLFAGIGSSYTYGINKTEGDNAALFGIPPLKIDLDLNYKGLVNKHWLTGYSVKLNTEIAAAQNRVASVPEGIDPGPWGYEPSDAHATFNLSFGLNSNSLPGQPKLRFVVKNVFDSDYQPFGSYIPSMGRNFKTMLSFTID